MTDIETHPLKGFAPEIKGQLERSVSNFTLRNSLLAVPGDNDRPKKFEDQVFNYIKNLPLEMFYFTWTKTSITNESAIVSLAKQIAKSIRTKKVH